MIPLDLFSVSKLFCDTFLVRPQRSDRPGGSRGGTGASFEGRPEAQGVVTRASSFGRESNESPGGIHNSKGGESMTASEEYRGGFWDFIS